MSDEITETREVIIPGPFIEGIESIDTRDLAAVLSKANPWMPARRDYWLQMAAGVKDLIEALAREQSNPAALGED